MNIVYSGSLFVDIFFKEGYSFSRREWWIRLVVRVYVRNLCLSWCLHIFFCINPHVLLHILKVHYCETHFV